MDVDQVTHTLVEIPHVIVLDLQIVLFQVTEALQGVEASDEVVKHNSQTLHQCQMGVIKDCTCSDTHFNLSAFESGTFKQQAIFLFCSQIHYSQHGPTRWTLSSGWNDIFKSQPF